MTFVHLNDIFTTVPKYFIEVLLSVAVITLRHDFMKVRYVLGKCVASLMGNLSFSCLTHQEVLHWHIWFLVVPFNSCRTSFQVTQVKYVDFVWHTGNLLRSWAVIQFIVCCVFYRNRTDRPWVVIIKRKYNYIMVLQTSNHTLCSNKAFSLYLKIYFERTVKKKKWSAGLNYFNFNGFMILMYCLSFVIVVF